MVIGLLGILKAGAAYVPLDVRYPAERLEYMIEDSGVEWIVSGKEWAERVEGHGKIQGVIDLDKEHSGIQSQSAEELSGGASAENLAYVIYTSGSTGRPKGVELSHKGVVNFLSWMKEELGMEATEKVLAVTPLTFDIAGLEMYLPLSVGAQVEIASEEEIRDGKQLAEKIEKNKVSLVQATPMTWQMMIEGGWEGQAGLKALCGGEALGERLAEQLRQRVGRLWNVYGPTETTIWSTMQEVEK